MRRTKPATVILETQLPFLYDTRTLRSLDRPSRKYFANLHCARWQSTNAQAAGQEDIGATRYWQNISSPTSEVRPINKRPGKRATYVSSLASSYSDIEKDMAFQELLSDVLARSEKIRHQQESSQELGQRTSFLQRKARSVSGIGQTGSVSVTSHRGRSTLTKEEKTIFKHIFDNLAKGQPASTPIRKNQDEDEDVIGPPAFNLDAYLINVNLDSILEELYGSSTKWKDEVADEALQAGVSTDDVAQYPKGLRRMALKARAAVVVRTSRHVPEVKTTIANVGDQVDSNPRGLRAREICTQTLSKLSEAFSSDEASEKQLQQLCEKYIFGFLRGIGPSKSSNVISEPSEEAAVKQEGETEENDKQNEDPWSHLSRTLHLPREEMVIPDNVPVLDVLSILCPAASILAVRHFILKFPNSPVLKTFVSRLRSMGPEAYVLGSSTALYNTLLGHQWNQFSDFKAMDQVLSDMQLGAVDFDLTTIQILDSIREERFLALSKDYLGDVESEDQTTRPAWWWQFGTTPADFEQVTKNWREIIVDTLEGTELAEDIPDIMYGDDMLHTLRQGQGNAEAAVML